MMNEFDIKYKSDSELLIYLQNFITIQQQYEQSLSKIDRQKHGIFLTNSVDIITNLINIVEIDSNMFNKRILEPSCGHGVFIIKLLIDVYKKFPDKVIINNFISNCIYFVDLHENMVKTTELNIENLYNFLFDEKYRGELNGITWDFTDNMENISIDSEINPFNDLHGTFDYVIGNPPYIALYGRRDKKDSESQRIKYLNNYNQFPSSLKNGKINLIMLFIEHSLHFLKHGGKLSFIIDVSFFETAYLHTRKYILDNTDINELHINIKEFDVVSGQIIVKLSKLNTLNNFVNIIDHKYKTDYRVKQSNWYNHLDEYKFRYNNCSTYKNIFNKISHKNDITLLQLYPNKNLRTCVMLLDMEEKFTFIEKAERDEKLFYPYYQGSKALSEKYGKLDYTKYFFYDKPLQDTINHELKIELEKQGIKNKKRLGLGETIIYDNPKIFIRQSAKEVIATIDLGKSSANNSLYVFSLRDNSEESVNFLYFLCGFLNANFITYYAQQMNIIRFSQGKQPQIKISDLGSIFIPKCTKLQKEISNLCKQIQIDIESKQSIVTKIDNLIYNYYNLTPNEIHNIEMSIKTF